MRIDEFLVKNRFFESRAKAQMAIKEGAVFVEGKKVAKAALAVNEDSNVSIVGKTLKYVSRGGLKLEKALTHFGISLVGKAMIDIGSSTGGFCDCALQNGVDKIYAFDVGTNQLHQSLRNNNKIKLFENTDFRQIDVQNFSDVQIATIDVSFISVTKLLDKLNQLKNLQEIICLIKPQFECGLQVAKKYKGIIKDQKIHAEIINNIVKNFEKIGFLCKGLTYSPITGGDGNIEYLLYLSKDGSPIMVNVKEVIKTAFEQLNK